MADSGGPSIHRMISITKIFPLTDRITAHQTSSCHTGHTRPDEELGTSSCLPKTTTFPASCRYAWKAREDDHYYPHIHSNSKASPICTHVCDFIVIKITYAPSQGGVVTISKHLTKILCRGSECLPSMCGKAGCTPKLLKVSSLSQNPI